MSHEIQTPLDRVLSTDGPEWHGLATVVPSIGEDEIVPLCFPILEGNIGATVSDGNVVPMSQYKALIADIGSVRPDLLETPHRFSPLHIPKKGYTPINNRAVWDIMKVAISGIGAKPTCIGTLQGLKKFFISVRLAEDGGAFTVNGDEYKANLNFITSHDGTIGMTVADSLVRVCCMNSLRAALGSKGDLDFKVYHCSGAAQAMANLGNLVADVLNGRSTFRTNMEYLAGQSCTLEDATLIALGYFARKSKKPLLSKQAQNGAANIALLFTPRGTGNKGETLYDLLNGCTQHFTLGDGTGKDSSIAEKIAKAEFGDAADHKQAFANLLMSPDSVNALREAGRAAQLEIARQS